MFEEGNALDGKWSSGNEITLSIFITKSNRNISIIRLVLSFSKVF